MHTSSLPVSEAGSGLSPEFSLPTRQTAYEPFTPNNSGQRSHPTYYRGCWHVVGRCFFYPYRHFRFVEVERGLQPEGRHPPRGVAASGFRPLRDRKSTRLNSSHANISYAVFCLKKKKSV